MARIAMTPRKAFDDRVAKAAAVDWARLAAFIDGEGSIVIAKSKPNPKFHFKNSQYSLRVSVNNTDICIVEWLISTFGGGLYDSRIESNPLAKKQGMAWVVQESQAAVILRGCLPYLIGKVSQAKTGVAFRAIKEMNYNSREIPSFQLGLRERYHQRMLVLNGTAVKRYRETIQ